MKYNNDWLIERFQAKERLKYIFFWKHTPSSDELITKTCLSQWWYYDFKVSDTVYHTAEHWMMAKKSELFNDIEILDKILNTKSPAEVQQLGRKVKNFDAKVWDKEKYRLVVDGNFHKFSQHPALKDFLLNTNERILVEASPVDKIWGIGMAADNPHIENPLLWKGENLLGYALMEVRDKLNTRNENQTNKR